MDMAGGPPFAPPREGLRAQGVTGQGIRYHIFDSRIERAPEERERLERNLAAILDDAARRRFWERQDGEAAPGAEAQLHPVQGPDRNDIKNN